MRRVLGPVLVFLGRHSDLDIRSGVATLMPGVDRDELWGSSPHRSSRSLEALPGKGIPGGFAADAAHQLRATLWGREELPQ
jgi:hypothetical protein